MGAGDARSDRLAAADRRRRPAFPLPAATLAPGQPLTIPLPAGALGDAGGLMTLLNSSNLRVDGVAYLGGDPRDGLEHQLRLKAPAPASARI